MKSFISGALLLLSFNSLAVTLQCDDVATNLAGVTSVEFTNPQSSIGGFKNMIVRYDSGDSEEFATDLASTVDGSTVERKEFSIFFNVKDTGIAYLEYTFFVLPEDQRSIGWSPKNGARMNLGLPPGKEIIRMSCVKKI